MDPSLLHSHLPSAGEDSKPPNLTLEDSHSDLESDTDPTSLDGIKRPRIRLAHACDRCRRRKIRCDIQQPCAPCSGSKSECTFNTPSRRVAKPKASSSSSAIGVKRPHSPNGLIQALRGGLGGGTAKDMEARLSALEAMLGDVPPKVHNAFLSSLDARLGSGTGVGLKEGKGEGVGPALEALGARGMEGLPGMSGFGSDGFGGWGDGFVGGSGSGSGSGVGNGLNAVGARLGSSSTLAPDWGAGRDWSGSGVNLFNGNGNGGPSRSLRRKEDEGVEEMAKTMEGMSFFYEDEIGQAKWQGATSGFPLLDILTAANAKPDMNVDDTSPSYSGSIISPTPTTLFSAPIRPRTTSSHSHPRPTHRASSTSTTTTAGSPTRPKSRFFPDRTPRPHQTLNPEASWKVITGVIPSDLMDTLVRCYLSTSHLLWPFLHVPSFLADYANPQQWGEPGFACFIVTVCTLSSRHVDDPRVRANPNDPSTAGKGYFELFKRLRDLPSADRPTLYSIQAAFLAAIYAFGLGNLSKAFALQAESITLCLDGGLHRSVDGYDHFDAVEKETRKRTFWSIYSWDKQSAALFGRPPIIHLRDCDVTEPLVVDDENLGPEGIKDNKATDDNSRMCAFVAAIRLHVILEGVIDSATQPSSFPTSPFLAQAAAIIARRHPQNESLRDEEALLEEWTRILPKYWQYDTETANSRDPIRITQAERLHCLEHLVKMIIYRHRFSGFVALPASTAEERARHLDLCRKAMQCALTIIADHVHISQRGMMTYYGVHVIHQLAQAGRTLVAVILNCRNADFRPIIAPAIEGLRSCVGLLRRFSGRYLCGLRSADIIDEFCRICNIPVDSPRVPDGSGRPSPAWLRPVRRRPSPSPSPSADRGASTSPQANLDPYSSTSSTFPTNPPTDLDALFNTSEYFDLSTLSPGPLPYDGAGESTFASLPDQIYTANNTGMGVNDFSMNNGMVFGDTGAYGVGNKSGGIGMDSVSDGLKNENGQQGMSAATILSLLEEGSFDYGSIFTDQAPLPPA